MAKLIILLLTVTSSIFAQTPANVIKNSQKLIEEKKYASAMDVLQKADPKNENSDIFVNKINLSINYHVQCIQGAMFAFKDLTLKEKIEDVRGSEGSFAMFSLDGIEILPTLLKKYPKNGLLHKAAGDYYYYHSFTCPGDQQNLKLALEAYVAANKNKVYDAITLGRIGELYVGLDNDFKLATSYLEKSIELSRLDARNNYNLSFCYLNTKKYDKAAKHAVIAYKQYQSGDSKADAAIIAMFAYLNSKNIKKSNEYANNIYRLKETNLYKNLKALLDFYIDTNQVENINKISDEFLLSSQKNPTLPQDLIVASSKMKNKKLLRQFFARNIKKFTTDPEVIGNLYFNLAAYDQTMKNNSEAKKNFIKARESFSKVFKSDHPVFAEIEKGLKLTD